MYVFRFTAHSQDHTSQIGDELSSEGVVTLQIRLPQVAESMLLKDGKRVRTWNKHELCTYITSEPGVYRVEVHIEYLGRRRGWIFSNPVYVR